MSLPPELRVLCLQLSSTPVSDLPRLTPALLRHILRCHVPLSSHAGNAAKADASASSVLVHKLKTQLSTLLNGKSPEGRFTAVVLIKAVVEVGGWEVLRGSESWVRGLLSVLGKPDPSATKELCVVTLTKIYCMTHQYQTLVREITTPTLPTFVTACLNLISSKSTTKTLDISSSLSETIFQSFAMLVPRHTTIYRPFVSQIRLVCRPCLAPTLSDGVYASPSLKESARRLVALLHQTVAKNAGGEEWGKALRDLVKDVHVTADNVFRAVIEDWESTAGYIAETIDANQEPSGGGRTAEDLPRWSGIDAGVERLTGLLETISEYLKGETSMPVSIPLGSIVDMITRMLSIAVPTSSESSTGRGTARLHPAIDRDERDSLWSGMAQIYVAALKLVGSIADRLEEGFLSLAQGIFDQLVWVFPFGRHASEFRLVTYNVTAKVMLHIGQSFDKTQAGKAATIIRSCCKDLQSVQPDFVNTGAGEGTQTRSENKGTNSNQNADTFLQATVGASVAMNLTESDLIVAAGELLPMFLSHLPQQYLDISLRSLIERTAILTHNKNAMLASVLNPFVGKNGKAMTSILPHLTREFGHDDVVEVLLRPRMPLLPSTSTRFMNDAIGVTSEDEDMEFNIETASTQQHIAPSDTPSHHVAAVNQPGLGPSTHTPVAIDTHNDQAMFGTQNTSTSVPSIGTSLTAPTSALTQPLADQTRREDIAMTDELEDSDDESVHLTMQLDTDSESE